MYRKLFIIFTMLPLKTYAYNFENISEIYKPLRDDLSYAKEIKYSSNYREPLSQKNIPAEYITNVKFWRDIYSYFDSNNILIHSKVDISNVFKIVNLKNLYQRESNAIIAEIKKNRIMKYQISEIKNELQKCYSGKLCKLKINKSITLQNVIKNLRTQTGQLDILNEGIKRFKPFEATIKHVITKTKSNNNWLAIPFLESSFNPKAVSKVGATGAWQIMKSVGKKLLPINEFVDGRRNPIIASYAALKILRENRIITKNEDISIIAYNSGLRNFFQMKKQMKRDNFTISEYLNFSKQKNKSFSFASENFLMEFHAMKEFLIKKSIINQNIENHSRNLSSTNSEQYNIYLSKCKTRPSRIISLLSKKDTNIKKANSHFKKSSLLKILPSGQIYITKEKLPKKYYKKIDVTKLDDMSPVKWKTDQINCSII